MQDQVAQRPVAGWVARLVAGARRLPAGVPRAPRLVIWLVLGLLLAAGATAGSILLILSELRDHALADSRRELQNTALVLAQQFDRTFRTVELVEIGLTARFETMADTADAFGRRLSAEDVHGLLRSELADISDVSALELIDARGHLVATSAAWPAPAIDLAGRADVAHARSDPATATFVSFPFRLPSGAWAISLLRKVTSRDGSLLGLVSAVMEVARFEAFYESLALGPGSSIGLLRHDGVMLARHPNVEAFIGRIVADKVEFTTMLAQADRGAPRQVGGTDGLERMVAAAGVPRYGLVVATTRTLTEILADWRSQARYLVALTFLLLLVIGGIGAALVRRFREQSLRLDAALNNISQGVAMFDAQQRLVVANRRYAEIYRLAADQVTPGQSLEEIIRLRAAVGTCPGDPQALALDILAKVRAGRLGTTVVRELPDGRSVAVSNAAMEAGGWVATHEDITARRRAEIELLERKGELERLNAQFDVALNNMIHGLCMYDADMRLIVCNTRYAEMYAIPVELTRPGTSYQAIVEACVPAPEQAAQVVAYMQAWRAEPRSFTWPFGDGRIIAVTHRPLRDGGWVGIHEDVTERKRAEAQIAHLAYHDALTGLPNRAAFTEKVADAIAHATAAKDKFALVSLDFDRFKEVNDVLGHAVGDDLMGEVAARLAVSAGENFIAHLGSDDFVLICAAGDQPTAAEILAERIQAEMARDITAGGHSLRVSASIGIAIFPEDGGHAAALLANADVALDRAKAEERGSIRFFDASTDQRQRDRRALQHDLGAAAERGEILIHYQPLARIDGTVTGFEALVRWQHPARGMIPPSAFIPIAEESGLIVPLGESILRAACHEAASWPRPLAIAVNLSPIQFRHGDLAGAVHAILLETGLAPARLELEITEGVLIGDFSRALAILRRLKDLGVKIAMDDFGTGYSSLSYLQAFPFDKIKLDRSFVSKVRTSAQSAAIVRTVIGLCRGLALTVVAEGVETQSELDFLVEEACDGVQGYFIGRPAPIEHYAGLIGGQRPAERWSAAG
jgi:diguanylate cyclase (GGDEF)-like protein